MGDGTLGTETKRGVYEDSDIPGAKDDGEVFDLRYWRPKCSIGLGQMSKKAGGIVTSFKEDSNTATSKIEYGAPVVNVQGATVCIIQTRTKVVSITGKKSYFEWYDFCCIFLGGEGDCQTFIKFIKEENETIERRTLMKPAIRCVTDWPKWALDKLLELIKSGASSDAAMEVVKKALSIAAVDKNTNVQSEILVAKNTFSAPNQLDVLESNIHETSMVVERPEVEVEAIEDAKKGK